MRASIKGDCSLMTDTFAIYIICFKLQKNTRYFIIFDNNRTDYAKKAKEYGLMLRF